MTRPVTISGLLAIIETKRFDRRDTSEDEAKLAELEGAAGIRRAPTLTPYPPIPIGSPRDYAVIAYRIADAMLAARAANQEHGEG